MSAVGGEREPESSGLFHFSQFEVPWELGPPDGRYLLRRPGDLPDAEPSHVLVIATLGAVERRRLIARRRKSQAKPEPENTPVTTGRATIIDVAHPLENVRQAQAWLAQASATNVMQDLTVLNRALHAFGLVTADPYVRPVGRQQLLVARVGFGAGERVANGLWAQAHELPLALTRRRRSRMLHPDARLAAVLTGREPVLVCEGLALRARLDLDNDRQREAALQVLIALDAALAELAVDPAAALLAERLAELRERRDGVALAAQAALAGGLSPAQVEAIAFTLGRIEAALRARAVAGA